MAIPENSEPAQSASAVLQEANSELQHIYHVEINLEICLIKCIVGDNQPLDSRIHIKKTEATDLLPLNMFLARDIITDFSYYHLAVRTNIFTTGYLWIS